MRRTLQRLFMGDFGELSLNTGVVTTMREKMTIDRQANLMHVQRREAIEGREQQLLQQPVATDMALRIAQYEFEHQVAAAKVEAMKPFTAANAATQSAATPYCHFVPTQWPEMPNGWRVSVDTTIPVVPDDSAQNVSVVSKTFSFLDQPATYRFLAIVGAGIEELGFNKQHRGDGSPEEGQPDLSHPYAIPKMEWMWSEVTITMLSTKQSFVLAKYLNSQESKIGIRRNQSEGGIELSTSQWSEQLNSKIQSRLNNNFMWMFNADKGAIQNFIQSTYVQWSNRAEYLISRKSRERREFRQDMTLTQAIQQGAERKRRTERRKFKDKVAEHGAKALGIDKDDYQRYTIDVLPREMREQLEEDRSKVGGMGEFQHRAGGMLAYSRINQQ